MAKNLSYREMTPEAQVNVIEQVADFFQKDLPRLVACGRVLGKADMARYEAGISLLELFPKFHSFCVIARGANSNLDQLVNRMSYLFNILKKDLLNEMPVCTVGGDQVINMAQAQLLRRGRPTAQESERRAREALDARRASVLSRLTGAKVATIEAAPIDENRESDTSRRKADAPDLFDQAVEEATSVEVAPIGGYVGGDVPLKSLREWVWILPSDLADSVCRLKDILSERAVESETAKRLLADGADTAEIAAHTARAKELNQAVADVYAAFDNWLSLCFVMLSEVNPEYGSMAKRYEKRGGLNALLSDLKPYADKMARNDPEWHEKALASAMRMEADRAEAESRDPEVEKLLHSIKTYFSRTDVKPTQSRLAGMKARYAKAAELGCNADVLAGYQVLIDDLEKRLAQ